VVPVRVAGGELAVDECDPAWRRWLDATAA
jgi:hypothetical protein